MIVDPLELMIAWWSDPAAGLNAELRTVPRDAEDAPPPDVSIFNEVEHPWVARGEADLDVLKAKRAWCIAHYDPETQGFPAPVLPFQEPEAGAVVHIAGTYMVHGLSAPRALHDARQSMRAAHRVISKRWEEAQDTVDQRDTTLFLPTVRYLPTFGQLQNQPNVWSLGTLVVSFPVLDRWALGLT